MKLTVLSALARIGFDPWREAAHLAGLPREAATRALATTIGALPEGDWKAADSRSIAIRLLNCLPKRSSPPVGSPHGSGVEDHKPKLKAPKWLVWIALGAAVLLAVLRMDPTKVSQPDPSDGWSTKSDQISVVK